MNYMEKGRKKNRLMPALITLMLLLSMIIIPQSVIAAAPDAPTAFTATTVSKTQIDLSWTMGAGALNTSIERNTTVSWALGEGTEIYNGTGESYSDTGLTYHTTYYYQAWSWNASGCSTDNASDSNTTNLPPENSIPSPSDGATGVNLNPDLQITVSDADGDEMNQSFWTNVTDSWVAIAWNNGTGNAILSTSTSMFNDFGTKYWWSSNVTDGIDWDNDTYTFTTAKDVPGVNVWEGGNTTIAGNDVLNISTDELFYGETITPADFEVNGSLTWGTDKYNLYYPVYYGSESIGSYNLTWEKYGGDSPPQIELPADKWFGDTGDEMDVTLNRSGLWLIGQQLDFNPNASSFDQMDATIPAWFWVNASSDLSIDISDDEFAFASEGNVIVNISGFIEEARVAIFNATGELIHDSDWGGRNQPTDESGEVSANKNDTSFLHAGFYNVTAVEDYDGFADAGSRIRYREGTQYFRYYTTSYGNTTTTPKIVADYYNWDFCGPWDPPEKNATKGEITVITGEPVTSIPVANRTMYWGFSGEVNISIKGYDGKNLSSLLDVKVFNSDDVDVTSEFTPIDNSTVVAGYLHISHDSWGKTGNTIWGENGTWYAYLYNDIKGDETEEWNTTVEWIVAAGPDGQWKWVDDDGTVGGVDLWGSQESNNDGIIPYIPQADDVPLDVEFIIYDSAGNSFGDLASGTPISAKECAENITISGNSLFAGKLSDFPGYGLEPLNCGYSGGVWSVPIIPTMSLGGGEITIKVTAFNSSVSEKISIGGENYGKNGSIVSVTPNDFMIDQENKTLTITVQNSETGVENPYMDVYLYYLDDGTIIAANTMKPITGHTVSHVEAVGDVYTISFNTTQQTTNQTLAGFTNIKAPRNLTIYVDGPGNREGYAFIQMKPVNDLETHISVETFMAGLDYDDVVISCDFVGNSTDTPSTETADKDSFFMKIVDENGDDVTGTSSSNGILHNFYNTVLTGAYSVEKDNVYGLDTGTYSIYAWNNTHNSEGHNATFEIKAVEVTCDKAPFIWSVDANISATFTITYNGNPVNGTLRIDNMSAKGTYNSTWTNCSFTGISDAAGNTSLEISKTKIINGVVTVHDISADVLHPDVAKQYITFWFKPTESNSVFAKATAQMTVEVPSITPDPMYIPLGRTTKVYCTATGRGETLSDVFIRLHGQGFDQNSTTDVDGRVAFSITPASTGNISIDVGETGRTLTDTVVYVVAWIIDVDVVAEVNEGEQFTVTVTKEGTTDVVVDATVTIKGIGTDTTGSNGQATFTAPNVTSDRTYTIKVTATGYAPDPDTNTIAVINIPKLILVIPDEVQATTTFEVAVADDTGGPIIGATITFNEKTYTTGVNGIAKLTAPKTKEDYPIEATFGTYVKATDIVTVTEAPGIPGFELLTLIVALGVAVILLRRRRR